MHSSPSPYYPWAALGIVLYLMCAVSLSIRSFSRRVSLLNLPPQTRREFIGDWMRATLAAFEPTLERLHITPLSLTFAQLGFSWVAGLAYALGGVFLGGCFVLGCGILDLLDGGLARRAQQASRRGAFLDSVIDRYAEFFTFLGLGVFFAHSWLVWVIVFGLFGSLMVSYTRARAEGLGTECRGGLMQRGERYTLLSLASWLSVAANHLSCSSSHFVLIAGLIFMAVSTNMTALSRVRTVAAALKDELERKPAMQTVQPQIPGQLPGQAKRLFGSLVLTLGAGTILDTSYQSAGISVMLAGALLVGQGWMNHWQSQKSGPIDSSI